MAVSSLLMKQKAFQLYRNQISNLMLSIWRFTCGDIKTIIAPMTLFAIVSLLSGPILTVDASPSPISIAIRMPAVFFWAWMIVLPHAIDNQRRPEDIEEDALNKPWRPIPSKLITPEQATRLMYAAHIFSICVSLVIGGTLECFLVIGIGYCYNTLKGADIHWVIRNLLNAAAHLSFMSGVLQVASGRSDSLLREVAFKWLGILGMALFTTIQTQDIHDQEGDSLRNRSTMPLVLGDAFTRWTLVLIMGFWSVFCPLFWNLGIASFIVPVALWIIVSSRYLLKRSVKADKATFLIYNLWIVGLYSAPLVKRIEEVIWA